MKEINVFLQPKNEETIEEKKELQRQFPSWSEKMRWWEIIYEFIRIFKYKIRNMKIQVIGTDRNRNIFDHGRTDAETLSSIVRGTQGFVYHLI